MSDVVVHASTDPVRSPAAAVAAAGLCVAIAALALLLVYPFPAAVFVFLAYVVVFNLVPGLAVAPLVFSRVEDPGVWLVRAWFVGVVANVLVYLPVWIAGVPSLFPVAVLAFVVACGLLRRRQRRRGERPAERVSAAGYSWVIDALLIAVTPLLTMALLVGHDVSANSSAHFAFEGVIVQGLARGWPPPFLLLGDVRLSYNYATHLWILAAGQVTGLSVDVLVARFAPVFFFGSAVASVLVFGRHVLRLGSWYARLVVVAVFWVVGVPPLMGQVFGTFTSYSSAMVISPSFGFVTFFLILTIVLERLRVPWPSWWKSGLLMAILSFIATGARGPSAPILLCALGMLWLVQLGRGRREAGHVLMLVLASLLGIALGLLVFFTLGGDISGAGFAKFIGHPFSYLARPDQTLFTLPAILIRHGVRPIVAGAIAFGVIVVFQASFLLPGLVCRLARLRTDPPLAAEALLLGSAIAGIAATFTTVAPGAGQFSFLQYTNIAFALLGAVGLQAALQGAGRSGARWQPGPIALVSFTLILLIVQLAQLPAFSLTWLGARSRVAAEGLVAPARTPSSERTIAPCMQEQDADLLALTTRDGANDPVVVLLGSPPTISYCEARWWVTRNPVRVIHDYSLEYLPGRPRGALKDRLESWKTHLASAVGAAQAGRLSDADLLSIARSFENRPVYVLAPQGLTGDAERFQAIGANRRFVLLRVRATSDTPKGSS